MEGRLRASMTAREAGMERANGRERRVGGCVLMGGDSNAAPYVGGGGTLSILDNP